MFVHRRRYGDMGLAFLEAASETVRSRLGADFEHPPDPLWSLGPESREWQRLQTRLLIVGRSQAVGELMATELIREARSLDEVIQSALSNR